VIVDMQPKGGFSSEFWRFAFQRKMMETAVPTQDDQADLINVVAHESRHAEQAWLAARVAAGKALGIDVTTGYYHVHGLSTDDTAEAADDAHEDDLWVILNQALEPQRHAAIRAMCLRYCDLWDEFWTEQMRLSK
jgi:hypothetical protein